MHTIALENHFLLHCTPNRASQTFYLEVLKSHDTLHDLSKRPQFDLMKIRKIMFADYLDYSKHLGQIDAENRGNLPDPAFLEMVTEVWNSRWRFSSILVVLESV